MVRKIIHIDEEKCNGCGLCAAACHEGAIDLVDGKAKLVRENFCDGFGDCLPNCPTGAITFEEREAPAYDSAAVEAARQTKEQQNAFTPHAGGCPGSRMMQFQKQEKASRQQAQAPVSRLIKSVTVVRMEVPCCGGLQRAAENALKASKKFIPWQVVTISRDGRILDD